MSQPPDGIQLSVASTPATADDLKWQREAERARLSGLASIQASAERWGTTLLAVTGLVGAVATIAGAEQLGELRDHSARVWFGVLGGLAVVAAGVAVLLAALAAQGKVVSIVSTGPELKRATLAEAARASRLLSASRLVSLVILPLALAAIGVLLYAPRESTAHTLVTLVSGDTICAARAAVVGDELRLPGPARLHSLVIPLSDVAHIEEGAMC